MSQANPPVPLETSSTTEEPKKPATFARALPWLVALTAVIGAVFFSPLMPESFNRWQLIPWVLMVLAIVTAVYFKTAPSTIVGDAEIMPPRARLALTVYLLAFGCGLVFMLVSLNSLDFPETAVVPQLIPIPSPSPTPSPSATPTPAPGVTQGNAAPQNPPPTAPAQGQNQTGARANAAATSPPNPAAPILLRVLPQSAFGSAAPKVELTVYGRNFTRESKVRFNAEPVAITYISDNLITAPLLPSHLSQVGSITVDVENPPNLLSNAITVPVTKPTAPLNVFFVRHPLITREAQLLLLVIFAGALGSYLHAIMSLADFIGNRSLKASWFWWYITRPFLGMAMALVFYAVVRGGFLAGTPADANVVNPFGVLAIGALVGMFSDKAAQKLKEIFDVVFTANNERADKLNKSLVITAAGGSLPDATADMDYQHSLDVSGGTAPPYTWSLVDSPTWLSIDATTGILSGLPGAEDVSDENKVTVKVVDTGEATGEATLNLKVTLTSSSPP